jgi:hypothetical protein
MPSQEGVLTRSFGTNRLRSLEPLLVGPWPPEPLSLPLNGPCPCGAPLRIIASEGLSCPETGGDHWRLGLQGRGANPLGSPDRQRGQKCLDRSSSCHQVPDRLRSSFGSGGLLTLGRESPSERRARSDRARGREGAARLGSHPEALAAGRLRAACGGVRGRSPRYRRSELLAWIRRGKPAT